MRRFGRFVKAVRSFQGKRRNVIEHLEPRLLLSNTNDLTFQYGVTHSGVDNTESVLTPANVNDTTFGKVFTTTLDGFDYAQPLYVSNVNITTGSSPGVHNVLYVATENDSLYALDASTGKVLWQDSFINPANNITTLPYQDFSNFSIKPKLGITSTPVIDLATHTLYTLAIEKVVINGVDYCQDHLYAIDITSGAIVNQSLIANTSYDTTTQVQTYVSGPWVYGTGAGSVNGKLYFDTVIQLQRSALTLANGSIYIAYASFNDTGPYHGWILGFDENTLSPTAVFNDTPNGSEGGIWEGGGGLAVDAQGAMYFMTGNGAFDTQLNGSGFPILGDYGDSAVKLTIDTTTNVNNQNINGWGLKVSDYFTPFNQAALDATDGDFGSGGPLLIPASANTGNLNLMLACGKEGRLYVINCDNMGKFDPNTDHVLQEVDDALDGLISTPNYFNGSVYLSPSYGGVAVAYSLTNGVLSQAPTSKTADQWAFPGDNLAVSANGTSSGIVWGVEYSTSEVRAYDATNLGDELWNSNQAGDNRDALGLGSKFLPPVIANGMVYVGTNDLRIVGYGLIPPPTKVPTAPTGVSATATVLHQVQLNWTNSSTNQSSVIIEDSTDGANFTTAETLPGYPTGYTITGLQSATKYYFKVIASNIIGNSLDSNVATVTTVAGAQGATYDFSSGFDPSNTSELTLNGVSTITNGLLQLTDNGPNEASSAFSSVPLTISSFHTEFTFDQNAGSGDGITFTVQGAGPSAVGSNNVGLGYQNIAKSVGIYFDLADGSPETQVNVTGMATGGANPVVGSPTPLGPSNVFLHGGHVMDCVMDYNGSVLTVTITDTVTQTSISDQYTVNMPAIVGSNAGYVGFTGSTGTLTSTQQIDTWKFTPGQANPTGLTAKAKSSTSVTLNWNEVATTQDGFRILASVDDINFFTVASIRASLRSYVAGGFQPNTTYYFQVVAMNSYGDSEPSNTATVNTKTGAAIGSINYPTGFSASSAAGLSLLGSSTIVGSALQLTDGGADEDSQAYSLSPINAQQFNGSFDFQLTNPNGEGITFILQANTPTTAGNGAGGMGSMNIPNSVAIKWDIFNDASEGSNNTGVFLEGSNPANSGIDLTPSGINLHDGDIFHVTLNYASNNLAVTITDTGTLATETHNYVLNVPDALGSNQAYAGFTASTSSATATQSILDWTMNSLPPQALSVTATPQSASLIEVNWIDPSTSQTGFTINRSTDGISFSPIGTVAGNVDSYPDQNFSGGVEYYYEVLATNSAGTSAASNIVSTVDPTPPTRPIDAHVTFNSAGEIDIAWTNTANNATGIMINRKVGDGTLTTIATLDPSMSFYDDKDITPGTDYEYHVQAFNISGNADFTGVEVTSIAAAPTMVDPVGGNNEITLSWQPSTGATGYNIYRATTSGGETSVALATNLTDTSFSDTGLPLNSTYYYEVTAVDPGGESVPSSEVWAETTGTSALTVVSVSPAAGGTSTSLSAAITATFNESVNFVTVSGKTFYLTPTAGGAPVTATVTYNDNNFTATLVPSAPLWAGVNYTAMLTSLIQDEFNDPLSTYTWSFTMPGGVADSSHFVSQSVPSVMTTGQQYSVTVTMQNTGDVNWNYVGGAAGIRLGSQDPQDNHTWGFNRVASPSPVSPGNNGVFTFTVTAPSTPGNDNFEWRMVDEHVNWFGDFTPIVSIKVVAAPTVVGATPSGGTNNVPTNSSFSATFSEAMDPATINSSTVFLTRAGAAPVPATVTYNSTNQTVTLQPSSYLATGASYRLTILSGASGVKEAVADVPLASDFTAAFSTTTTPADAATYISESVPTTMVAGQQYSVTVTMLDTGTNTWNYVGGAAGIRLGSQDAQDNHTWGMNRVPESSPVTPGNDAVFTFNVTAPLTPGNYNFEWRMVDERIQWFGDFTPIVSIMVNTGVVATHLVSAAISPVVSALTVQAPLSETNEVSTITDLALSKQNLRVAGDAMLLGTLPRSARALHVVVPSHKNSHHAPL